MGNNTLGIARKSGFAEPNQFCSSLLQNWDLNTHRPRETFRTQEMKRIRVQV
jgi:hypothetical protein